MKKHGNTANREDARDVVKRNIIEIIEEKELEDLFTRMDSGYAPSVYCGYEPSGSVHLGHLVTMTKLMDFAHAGFKVKILFADWHAWLNKKGDWDFIGEQVKEWKKGFKAAGLGDAEFIVGTSYQKKVDYIEDVFLLAHGITVNRALRSMQQVARDIENAHISQVLYPLMQVADIKHLNIDVAYGGIEQRKIHMLAREDMGNINYKKPVCVHTPLISSLKGEGKMSSSEKETMITILDDEDTIKQKMKRAYCPEGIVENNPVLEIARLIIMPRVETFTITRPEKFGGTLEYTNYEQLAKDFADKKLHPMDLKAAVADSLVPITDKIRNSMGK